ncbi:MAG: YDG domain-containing protein [Oscillospiraceae bacterium]|nr:YDG domain-containing protein [Oscillospiraceae bacterium]
MSVATVNGSTVTIIGAGSFTITATKAGDDNYLEISVTSDAVAAGTASLTITGVTAVDRAYDGKTTVGITGGSLEGVFDGDDVSPIVPPTGTIDDENPGDNKPVTLDGNVALEGADAGKYTLTQPAGITVNIWRALISGSITISGGTDLDDELTIEDTYLEPSEATYRVTWLRDGTDTGETGDSYTITKSDLGKTIKAEVTGTGNYDGTLESNGIEIPLLTPEAPRNLRGTPGERRVTLNWDAPFDGGSAIIRYEISIDDGANWTDAGLNTEYPYICHANGTEYTFKVRAVNDAGAGEPAIAQAAPQADPNNNMGIGGAQFDLDHDSSGPGWIWRADSKTLTLTGGDIGEIDFVTADDITVVLDSSLAAAAFNSSAITAKSIRNTGLGGLTITSPNGSSIILDSPVGPAISANGSVIIDSGGVYASTRDENAPTIHSAFGSVIITGNADATITSINGSSVKANAGIEISTTGSVTATATGDGFTLEAENGGISITDGTTSLTAADAGRAFSVEADISGDNTKVYINDELIYPDDRRASSGCNAGVGAAALILALGVLWRRRGITAK